jgi:hypothetical protein
MSSGETLLSWFLNAKSEGEAWLANQPGAKGWDQAMLTMSGTQTGGVTDLSQCQYPKVQRQSREMVDSLSSFRHEGEFKVLWDDSLYDTAHLLTQLDRHWYKQTMANLAHRAALQYGVNLGTAYLYETWDPTYWSADRGDIKLQAIGPGDVTFVQLPKDNDIQKAYVVLIRQEMPINLAKRLWMRTNPTFANALVPDREQPSNSAFARGLAKVQQFLSPALRAAGRTGQNDNSSSFPTVDIYTAYTMDSSINLSPDPIRMGVLGTNWSYTVPSLGSPMPTGIKNPITGEEFTVPAKESDCLMFPLRRMTIFSATAVAYDGSSPWWHGEVPLARLWFKDTPWSALGSSITADVQSMETGIVELLRIIEDAAAARMDPFMLVDDQLVAGSWAEQINIRKAGIRAKAPLSQGNPIQFPLNPQQYDVPNWIPQFITEQENRMDYITGVRDLVAMAKAKQIPGSDTLEKLMEMAGPIVQGMVRVLQRGADHQHGRTRGRRGAVEHDRVHHAQAQRTAGEEILQVRSDHALGLSGEVKAVDLRVHLRSHTIRHQRNQPDDDAVVLPATDEGRLPDLVVDVRQDRSDPELRTASGRHEHRVRAVGRGAAHQDRIAGSTPAGDERRESNGGNGRRRRSTASSRWRRQRWRRRKTPELRIGPTTREQGRRHAKHGDHRCPMRPKTPPIADLKTYSKRYVTPAQLADYVCVTRRTIYTHIDKGVIKVVHVGGVLRIKTVDARQYAGESV